MLSLLKNLNEVKSQSGGTSLITFYIPSSYDLSLVSAKMTIELSTASNIKDKTVRKDVTTALKRSQYQIKNYGKAKAPMNGLVLCSGDIVGTQACF